MKKTVYIVTLAMGFFGGSRFALADVTASDVLNDLHKADQMEVHMGNLAQEKGMSEAVRSYGKTLAGDHQDNDQKVRDLAAKKGIKLKEENPGMMESMEMKHLQALTGAEFDQKFAKAMIDDHKKDIEKLQKAQKSPLPDDVRELVGNTLPTLQKHLETAQRIYGQPS